MTPGSLLGFARLFRMALAGGDIAALRAHLVDRTASHPDDADTLLDLSTVLQLMMQREAGLELQARALRIRQLYRVAPGDVAAPSAGARPPLRILALMSPGDFMANTPLDCLLEGSNVTLDLLYVDRDLPVPAVVPAHDVLFVAVGESDRNRPLLGQLREWLRGWPEPVVNDPARLLDVSRERVSERLRQTPGLVMPAIRRLSRSDVERIARGGLSIASLLGGDGFPILLRPAGSHAGRGLDRLDDPAAVAAYLGSRPEEEFSLSPFVDYRGADGRYRKYRIALIGGRPYLSHLAISAHWMIHYLNAGMADAADKRAEEAQAMAQFDQAFARRHAAALAAIAERMGLDYLVLDAGETPDGRLLLFEADNCMVVHAMDPPDVFPYKGPQMRKVFDAFVAMLTERAGTSAGPCESRTAAAGRGAGPSPTARPLSLSEI